jgi:hypothetical protein
METEIIENGHQSASEAIMAASEPYSAPRLQAGQLRRLARMGAGVEGATEVAQAAIAAHNQRRQAYQQAFEAACEDVGITIPPGEHDVQIDWGTGEVRFVPR